MTSPLECSTDSQDPPTHSCLLQTGARLMRKRAVGGWLGGEQGCQGRGGGKQTKTWTVKYINKQFGQKSSLERFKANRLHQSRPAALGAGPGRLKVGNCGSCGTFTSRLSGSRVSQIDGKLARKCRQIIVKTDCGSAECGLW